MPQHYAPPPRRRRRRRASPWLPAVTVLAVLAVIAAAVILLVTMGGPAAVSDTTGESTAPPPPVTEPPETEPATEPPPETEPPVVHTLDGTLSLLHYGTGAADTDYTADRLIYALPDRDVSRVPADKSAVKTGDTLFVQQLAHLSEAAAEAEQTLAELTAQHEAVQLQTAAERAALEQLFMRRGELAAAVEALQVTAPDSGTLLTLSALPGMTIRQDQTMATLLTSPSLQITQYFSYAHAATVFVGMKAYINISDPELLLDATVTDISFLDHTDEEGVPCFAVTMDVELSELLVPAPERLEVNAYFQNDRGIKIYPMIPGKLHFRDLITVAAPSDCTVVQVFAEAGATLTSGAPLFELQNPSLVLELSDLEAQLPIAIGELNVLEQQLALLIKDVTDAAAGLERIREAIEADRKFGIAAADGILCYLPTMAHMTEGVLSGTQISPHEPLMLIARSDMTALLFALPTDEEAPAETEASAADTTVTDTAAADTTVTDTPLTAPTPAEAIPLPAVGDTVTVTVASHGVQQSTSATVRFVTGRCLILTVPDEVAALFTDGDVSAVISYEEVLP